MDEWKLGGAGGWGPLLCDSSSNLLFIPRTDRVALVDTGSGDLKGEVTGFGDARNVALDTAGRFAYVTDIMDGSAGFVRVFDRQSLTVTATIRVGRIPTAIVFDPVTSSVLAFSMRERKATVIDTATNTAVADIPLPGKPHLAVTDGKGAIFVSFKGIGQIARIDTASRKVTAVISTAPCAEFTGMAWDAADRQLIGTCEGQKIYAVNVDSAQVTTIGECTADAADLAYDPQRHLLYSGSTSGLLTVFRQRSAQSFTREDAISTQPRAGTLVFDPKKGRVFLVSTKFQQRPVSEKGLEEMQSRLIPVPDSFRVIVVGRE